MAATDYAGDVSCMEAWAILQREPKAQLIDVRTMAEWTYVGLPDLSSVEREVHCVEWLSFPQMAANPNFVSAVADRVGLAGADEQSSLFFLCRSGARSRAAAIAMTRGGFAKAYNIAGGFEGDLDEDHHRGRRNGWKADGLPWRQS